MIYIDIHDTSICYDKPICTFVVVVLKKYDSAYMYHVYFCYVYHIHVMYQQLSVHVYLDKCWLSPGKFCWHYRLPGYRTVH